MEAALTAAALAVVVWFFHWTVSAMNGFDDWGDFDYYRLLVRGWRQGHLYIDKMPAPELVALADPYDPAQNGPYRLPDASYFRGRYYLYFGAAPALVLMLPYTLVTGAEMTTGAAVFLFCTLAYLVASGLWLALRRRYFPQSAVWTAPLGVLVLGFGTHLLALTTRPMWWELPIAAGIAFCMLALAGVYRAIHGTRPLLAMVAAGSFLGLAIASRPTCLLAAPLLLAPLWLAWMEARARSRLRNEPSRLVQVASKTTGGSVNSSRGGAAVVEQGATPPPRLPATPARAASWWRMGIAAAVPVSLCLAAMAAHNYARFEHPLEFGQNYQLSGAYEGKLQHFNPRFLPHNLAVYLFQPLNWTWEFPYAEARVILTTMAGYFGTEEVAGLGVTFPFVWLALAVPLAWRWREPGEARRLRAMLGGVAGYFVPVCLVLLCYFATTARYMADFAFALGVLALCGWLGLERWAQRRPCRRLVTSPLAIGLGVTTAVVGALMSFDYHGRQLRRANAPLWQRLSDAPYSALSSAAVTVGQLDGPRVLKVRFQQRPEGAVETFWRAADPRAAERIFVEHMGEQLIRFGYARGTEPVRWGRLLRWKQDHSHTVELQLPSLYRASAGAIGGLRRGVEFRERTSAAVRFSGGPALAEIVDPLPGGIAHGGAVTAEFSGQVRHMRTRPYQDDDTGLMGSIDAAAPRGGTLQLRLVLPSTLAPEGEPLFAVGALYGSDMVFVRDAGEGVMFVFEHYGFAPIASAPLNITRLREHTLEIVLPSCRPDAFGEPATGEVIMVLNGVEILRAQSACHWFPVGTESIGRNPFGTTCAPEFRGWIVDARWTN